MRRRTLLAPTLLALGALIAGCGSQTRTVTVSSAPHPKVDTSSTSKTSDSSTSKGSPSTTSTATGSGQSTSETTTTRTSTAPAFVTERESQAEQQGGPLHAAVAKLQKQGYTPRDTAEYHPHQTLRVMVGMKPGSGGAHVQRAFFFLDGRYIGTDASQPSADVRVVSQSETEVTLSYGLYRHGDSLCCPGGGDAKVTFQLNNGKLVALSAIPPAHSQSGSSRL